MLSAMRMFPTISNRGTASASLVELLVVCAILGLLAAILLATISRALAHKRRHLAWINWFNQTRIEVMATGKTSPGEDEWWCTSTPTSAWLEFQSNSISSLR